MSETKRRHIRLELMEHVESGDVPGVEDGFGYEVYYGRSEDGEPASGLTEEEITNFLMTGMADIVGLHLTTLTTAPRQALQSIDRFIVRLRHSTIQAIQDKFGTTVHDLAPKSHKKVVATGNKEHDEAVEALGDVPEWNKELLRKALKNPEGQGNA